MITKVEFRDLPPIVCNYYDRGPSDRRVLKAHSRPLRRRRQVVGLEYVVVTNFGRDYWRQDKWGDWKLWKSSTGVAPPTEWSGADV